jgi:phage terminase small subunit
MPLNQRQKLFAYEYLVDGNATQAAIRAGYSERTAGSQAHDLLKKPEIQAVIGGKVRAALKKADISIDDVIAELSLIVELDPIHAYAEDGSILPMRLWPAELRRACSGFEIEERLELTEAEAPIEVRVKKVKFWSKTSAAELVLRKLKAFRNEELENAAKGLVEMLADVRARKDDGE